MLKNLFESVTLISHDIDVPPDVPLVVEEWEKLITNMCIINVERAGNFERFEF